MFQREEGSRPFQRPGVSYWYQSFIMDRGSQRFNEQEKVTILLSLFHTIVMQRTYTSKNRTTCQKSCGSCNSNSCKMLLFYHIATEVVSQLASSLFASSSWIKSSKNDLTINCWLAVYWWRSTSTHTRLFRFVGISASCFWTMLPTRSQLENHRRTTHCSGENNLSLSKFISGLN